MRFSTYLFLLTMLVSAGFVAKAQSQSDAPVQETLNMGRVVSIFPNPAVEFVHVKIESASSANIKLTLHNIIGNEMPVETEVVSDHELRVRVKDLASGYYLIAVKDNESKFRGTYKFLKK